MLILLLMIMIAEDSSNELMGNELMGEQLAAWVKYLKRYTGIKHKQQLLLA